MKAGKIVIFLLIVAAFGAGIFFKDDAVKFYDNFNVRVKDFQQTQVGQTISQVEKQILSPSPLSVGGTSNNVVLLQSKIIAETNLQRNENGGLVALTENSKLDQTAAAKAEDILKNQYFEHVSPAGVGPGELAQKYGYDYIVEGENLILGNFLSEKEVVQDWMNSPGHRANILNVRYTEMGASIVKGTYKGDVVWVGVQEFGLPASACTQPDVNLKNQIDLEKTQLDDLSLQITDKKSQIDSMDTSSSVYSQMVDDYNKLVGQYNGLSDKLKADTATYNEQVNNYNNCVAGK